MRHTFTVQLKIGSLKWHTLFKVNGSETREQILERINRQYRVMDKLFIPPLKYRIVETVSEVEYLD